MAASSSRQARSKRLLALIDQFTPEIRAAFLEAIAGVTNNALIGEITNAIQAGDPLRAVRIIAVDDVSMRPLSQMIERAFETGGLMTAKSFPVLTDTQGIRTVFRFDVRNSRAEAWLRDHSSELVTRITDEQLGVIRDTISLGVNAGTNPRSIALDLVGRIDPTTGRRAGGVIGLNGPQAKAVVNAKIELADPATASNWFTRERRDRRFDPIVQKSITTETPLDSETIDKLTGRYSDSLLQLRGETIARTEALASLNKSQDEAFQQAVDDGLIQASAVKRIWDATGDNRTRESHMAMNGQAVGMNEPFVSPVTGARLMHPGDFSLGAPAEEIINCRCRIRTDVDFLAGVDDSAPTPRTPKVPRAPKKAVDETPPIPVEEPAPIVPEIAPRPIAPIPPFVPPTVPEISIRPITPIDPIPGVAPVQQQFAYQDFKPLPTVDAAKGWISENIANRVEFTKGVKLDGLNDLALAISEVNQRFDLPKLPFMGDPNKSGINWRMPTKATAAYGPSYDMFLMRNLATDRAAQAKAAEYGNGAFAVKNFAEVTKAMEGNRFISDEVRQRFKKLNRVPWSVSNEPKTVAYHEMGHRFDRYNRAAIRGFNINLSEGWPYLVGKYAGTNLSEYIAETFSLYMQGDESQFFRIHPVLLRFYQSKDLLP